MIVRLERSGRNVSPYRLPSFSGRSMVSDGEGKGGGFELDRLTRLDRLHFPLIWSFLPVLADYCKKNFVNWGEEGYGEGLTRVWTGILTSVKDYLPLVGEVPSSPGLFISAGFVPLPPYPSFLSPSF